MTSDVIKPTHFTLHVTIKVSPSNIEPFLKALRPCWQAVIDEPECVLFDVFHDPENPGTFKFVECWNKDEKWLRKVQLNKPYYKAYQDITVPMWIEPRQILIFNRVEGWSYANEEYLAGRVNA
jgi:quinol monooxygenase YgiN